MEITVINRTTRTMTDLSVELSVTGSFNIIEKPAKVTLDAGERKELRAIIKVNSTETGFIFGSVTFSYSSSAEHVVVNLNEVSVSLMEYIKPADWWARRRGVRRSNEKSFRAMWSAFSWENKHMKIVSDFNKDSDSDFMAANLYVRMREGGEA